MRLLEMRFLHECGYVFWICQFAGRQVISAVRLSRLPSVTLSGEGTRSYNSRALETFFAQVFYVNTLFLIGYIKNGEFKLHERRVL